METKLITAEELRFRQEESDKKKMYEQIDKLNTALCIAIHDNEKSLKYRGLCDCTISTLEENGYSVVRLEDSQVVIISW